MRTILFPSSTVIMTLSVDTAIGGTAICMERSCDAPTPTYAVKTRAMVLSGGSGCTLSRCRRLGRSARQRSPSNKRFSGRMSAASVTPSGGPVMDRSGTGYVDVCRGGECAPMLCRSGGCDHGVSIFAAAATPAAAVPLLDGTVAAECTNGAGGMPADGSRCVTQLYDAGASLRNESGRRYRNNYSCHYSNSGGSGYCCCSASYRGQKGHKGGQSQVFHNSPLFMGNGGNLPPNRGVISNYHYHHHPPSGASHHHHQRCAVRSHRRRGFGAAAVEAIRSRFQAGATMSHHAPPLSAVKCNRQTKQTASNGDQEPRQAFQVPLPRSKAAAGVTQPSATSCDAGVVRPSKGDFRIEMDTPFSATDSMNDPVNGSSRLSGIAPLFDLAIQQLILECDRRVANASGTACASAHSPSNSCNSQKQSSAHFSVNTHSFDMPTASHTKTTFAQTPKESSFATFAVEQAPLEGGQLESPHRDAEAEVMARDGACTTKLHRVEPRLEERVTARRENHVGNVVGRLFRDQSEDAVDLGSDCSKLQLLIVSVGLTVSFGESAPLVLIGTLIYLFRIVKRCDSEYSSVTAANWYRLTAVALLVATKMYVDGSGSWNECFSNATDIPLKELNKLEIDFLFLLDFDALITEEEVEARADWMDSVASRHDMMTPLRTFVLGSSCAPSCVATPLSPAADEAFRSVPLGSSSNMPSTPLSLTPSNMTPVNCFSTPFTQSRPIRNQCVGSLVSGVDASDKQQQQTRPSSMRRLSSSLCPCDRMSPLPLSVSSLSLTERLFSVVHAPAEPETPPSLRRFARQDDEPVSPLTPPDQERMSPVFFFCNATRGRRCNAMTAVGEKTNKTSPAGSAVQYRVSAGVAGDAWNGDEMDEEGGTPPHPRRCILSPPTQEAAPLPPLGMTDFHHRLPRK